MANEILPNTGVELPDVGSDQDTWGDILNNDLRILDTAIQYDVISKTLSNVDVTLTAAEAASAVIDLSGTLTANVNVIVPATPVRVYLVRNQTSGAFTVTVKTAAGTGTAVQQGTSSLVYSDGTNIIQGATSVNGSFAVSGALTAGSLNNTPVGNTTPSSGAFTTLSASGATTLNGAVTLGDAAGDAITVTGTATFGQAVQFPDGTAALPSITNTGDTDTGIYFPAADTVGISTTGSERLRIDSAGKIGIGTTAPQLKLHTLAGTDTALFESTGSRCDIYLKDAGTTLGDTRIRASSGNLVLITGLNDRVTLNSAGNMGLGVTPRAWSSGVRALQIGSAAALDGTTASNNTRLANNSFVNADGANVYINTGFATNYQQNSDGNHVWRTAPSGTAGDPITFTQAMTLTNSGRLLVGTTTASTGAFAEFTSTTGALIVPRMTTAQRDDMGAVANGAVIYNTTTNKMNFRENGAWVQPTVTAA